MTEPPSAGAKPRADPQASKPMSGLTDEQVIAQAEAIVQYAKAMTAAGLSRKAPHNDLIERLLLMIREA